MADFIKGDHSAVFGRGTLGAPRLKELSHKFRYCRTRFLNYFVGNCLGVVMVMLHCAPQTVHRLQPLSIPLTS